LGLALGLLAACAGPKPIPIPVVQTASDPDRDACQALCAHEKRCGSDEKVCAASCEADRRRMKPGFVTAYVRCFEPKMDCKTLDDKAREQLHLGCFDAALARFAHDDENQRDMAEAVCNRGERCLGLGKLGRDACMQATLNPQEPEVKLGQRLVDALRRDRVTAFRRCVDAAPCAKLDTHDDAVDTCYAKTIGLRADSTPALSPSESIVGGP